MRYLFFTLYVALLLVFFVVSLRSKRNDHVFAPLPGYVLMFSTYYMIGSELSPFEIHDEQWLLYMLAMLGFLAGGLVLLINSSSTSRSGSEVSTHHSYFISTFNKKVAIALALISYTITSLLWLKNGVPFFSENVDEARMTYASSGYLATLATTLDIVAVYCMCYIVCCLKTGHRKFLIMALLIIFSFLVIAILSGSRSRLMKLILPGLIIYHFLYARISIAKVLMLGAIGLLFIGFVGFYRAYSLLGDGIWHGLSAVGADTFFGGVLYYASIELSTAVYGLSIVLDVIPERADYTMGMLQVSPILMPLPFSTPTPGMFFKALIGGTWSGAGLAATFIAPMYADFSYMGVFLSTAFFGFVFCVLYKKSKVDNYKKCYFTVIYGIFFFFLIAGIRSDFVSFEFIWFMAVAVFIYMARKRDAFSEKERMYVKCNNRQD